MNRIPQVQLEEIERKILKLGEYDKMEITNKEGKIKIVVKISQQVVINCEL